MSVKIVFYGNPNEGARKIADEVVLSACLKVQSKAKKLAPYDTGRLRDSISFKCKLGSNGDLDVNIKDGLGYVGTNVGYAVYQEFGNKNMKANPFMRPAIANLNIRDTKLLAAISKAMLDSTKKGTKIV